jgi:hypothetical protein
MERFNSPSGVPRSKSEKKSSGFHRAARGNPDAPKPLGELVAVIGSEKAAPAVALAVPLLVITAGATTKVRAILL